MLFKLVVRNGFARLVCKVFAHRKLLLLSKYFILRWQWSSLKIDLPWFGFNFQNKDKGDGVQVNKKKKKSLVKMPAMGFPCGLEGCPKTVELRSKGQCSGCKKIHYCSQEHQTRDWKRHKKDCKVITACPNNVQGSMRNTERLFLPTIMASPRWAACASSISKWNLFYEVLSSCVSLVVKNHTYYKQCPAGRVFSTAGALVVVTV